MSRALITGSASGIGRALALRQHEAGVEVMGVDRDSARAGELPFRCEHCDLAHQGEIEALLDRLDEGEPFDLVVHNAGINNVGPFETADLSEQERVIAVNLTAPLLLSAGMLQRDLLVTGGAIVFVSSLSHHVGYPGAAVYAATKDGIASYARSLYVELGPRDVNVLTVFPGPVRTAHARRHSPAGSDERKRMRPEVLAAGIEKAIRRRSRVLVPGFKNKFFAFLGRHVPRLTERGMRKAVYDKLPPR